MASIRTASARLCVHVRLQCHIGVALEDLSWRNQLVTVLRTRALVGYHGSGLGGASLWLTNGAAVLEFLPPGCWWCAFASGVARPNCTRGKSLRAPSKDRGITWLLSTTAETPEALTEREEVTTP